MRKVAIGFALAVSAAFGTTAVPTSPAVAQQEIQLTVAAGQPLRAMRPLQMVEDFFIPEVDKRIKAAGLDKKAIGIEILEVTGRVDFRALLGAVATLLAG